MVGELVMLPVRVGVRVTRLWFRAVEETVSVTASTTGRVIEVLSSRGSGDASRATPPHPPTPTTGRPSRRDAPAERGEDGIVDSERDRVGGEPRQPREAAPTEVRDFAPRLERPAQGPPLLGEPDHVSEEPEVVEEFAEPGAEEGAGAEVRVEPPWDGYERMNATQVISRLAGGNAAQLAAVELYEGTHRRRQTILNAVERELRHANGGGSHTQERG